TAGAEGVFFAHIRSARGPAVTSAAAGVVDFGYGIDPHHGIARAARLGLGFARVLAFLRRRHDGCRRCGRHAPALGHEYAFGLAARLNGRLFFAPVIVALPGCLLLRDRGLRQSQQSYQCRTHSEGRFHHTCLRVNSAHPPRPGGPSAGETETAALAAAMWSAAPDRQRPIVRPLFLKCQEQRAKKVGKRKRLRRRAPPDQLQAGCSRRQCAVSVEESASTAGSVVTEASVGLAFSSSHSIGSGVRRGARPRTPPPPATRTTSRAPFLPPLSPP